MWVLLRRSQSPGAIAIYIDNVQATQVINEVLRNSINYRNWVRGGGDGCQLSFPSLRIE